ncbi:MAG: hypothetical protein M3362_11115 [Acidobacteriota bacterium]|nr:hypothetical protein [Acidobacteriota bacterium]
MKEYRGIVRLTALLLCLMTFSAPKLQAQVCGGGFISFEISDSEGKSIPDVTIEIVAEVTYEQYLERLTSDLTRYNDAFFNVYKISGRNADEIVRRRRPMNLGDDFCNNPLKQRANSTKVSKRNSEPGTKNFGYCTAETYRRPLLLKISAPGHLSDYYIGPFLGGCGGTYKFALVKKK